MMRTSGIAELPSGGSVCIEAFADPPLVIEALTENDIGSVIARWLGRFGFDRLGPIAWRTILETNVLRSGGLFSAPSPRAGLLACLDQQPLVCEPPSWVPADADAYLQVNMPLAGIYDSLRSTAIEALGPEYVHQLEATLNDSLGPDLPATISSLGRQHCFVQYPARGGGASMDVPKQRWSWVWQSSDAASGLRFLKPALTWLTEDDADPPPADEQGFTGWRAGHDDVSAALFAGKGYLTLCFGPDVTSRQLSVLAQPPVAQAALLGSPLMQRAHGMMPLGSGLGFLVADFGQVLRDRLAYSLAVASRQQSGPAKEGTSPDEVASPVSRVTTDPTLHDLLPPDDQLARAFGALVAVAQTKDCGLVVSSTLWLNPPAADR